MKKKVFGKKLSRASTTRKALARSLAGSMIKNGSIETTHAKAVFVQHYLETLVKSAKAGGIAKRRRVYASLANNRQATDLIFTNIAPAFMQRSGGYTRIVKLPNRKGDQAKMARLEWVEKIEVSDKEKGLSGTTKKRENVEHKDQKAGLVARLRSRTTKSKERNERK